VGRRCLFGVGEVPGLPGGRFFSKSQRWGTTADPMQSSLVTERIWLRLSVPVAGGGQTMYIGCSGRPQALRGSIFLKIPSLWNNRWPYAIVACNRAYLATFEPPCSRRWVDDAYLEFGRFPGSQEPIFLKIPTIGNNRWPYAIVACNRAYLATFEPPCSRRWPDDAYLEFGRFPGSQKNDFSQNPNDREQPLALYNRRL
jgi:hypothetical protein